MRVVNGAAPLVLGLDPELLKRTAGFERTWPGVEMAVLYRDEVSGSSAALLRYEPGASIKPHRHTGFEHVLVLEGSQQDERGRYSAGTLVVNPPGTMHHVSSPEGCLVLVIWQSPVEFIDAKS